MVGLRTAVMFSIFGTMSWVHNEKIVREFGYTSKKLFNWKDTFMRKKIQMILALFCLLFIEPSSFPRAQSSLEPTGGIGVILEFLPDKKIHRIRAVFQGSPAARAQIKAGDEILMVDGQSTQSMSFEDLGKKIRGTPGEKITLTLRSPSLGQTREVALVRVGQQKVSPLILNAPGTTPQTPPTTFTPEEKEQIKSVIGRLKTPEDQKKMEKLLLDLKEGRLIKPDFFKILKVEFH